MLTYEEFLSAGKKRIYSPCSNCRFEVSISVQTGEYGTWQSAVSYYGTKKQADAHDYRSNYDAYVRFMTADSKHMSRVAEIRAIFESVMDFSRMNTLPTQPGFVHFSAGFYPADIFFETEVKNEDILAYAQSIKVGFEDFFKRRDAADTAMRDITDFYSRFNEKYAIKGKTIDWSEHVGKIVLTGDGFAMSYVMSVSSTGRPKIVAITNLDPLQLDETSQSPYKRDKSNIRIVTIEQALAARAVYQQLIKIREENRPPTQFVRNFNV